MNSFKKQVFIFMIILADVATRIFKQYPTLDEIWLTADGQGFRKQNDAIQHSKYLDNKKVEHHIRSQVMPLKKEPKGKKETDPTPPANNPDATEDGEADREALLKQYADLFGKEAPGNIKTKTLLTKVNEALAKSQEEE